MPAHYGCEDLFWVYLILQFNGAININSSICAVSVSYKKCHIPC